jgi:uncharacterized membrane protein
MRVYQFLILVGLCLLPPGFLLLFKAMDGGVPVEAAWVGFAFIILGPLLLVGGLLAYLLRRRSPSELAIRGDDSRRIDPLLWRLAGVGMIALGLVIGIPAITEGKLHVRHVQLDGTEAVVAGIGAIVQGAAVGLICLFLSLRKPPRR